MITIGSTAIRHWLDEWREPRDLDILSPEPIEGAETFWHPLFLDYEPWVKRSKRREGAYATLDELYTLKVSHSYWELDNGSWNKHIHDAWRLKERYGAELIPELHDLLYKVWEEKHGVKRVDLDMDKTEFFSDGVKRKYEHDTIHETVCYYDRPLYERCVADGATVKMSMAKVWAMPFEDQVRMFREEVFVTALERIVIPENYKCSAGAAYAWALRRTITSLTKGKSAQFMVENFDEFRRPDVDYVRRHLNNSSKLRIL